MLELYPASPLVNTYRLRVSAIHELAISEYGNPQGIPVIYCHGGPGAGSKPHHAQYFDTDKFRVILFDQRGAGLSTPRGCLEENTTADLIADMEKIRELFGIEKWVVGGGSWGSTLSLLYAEQHPERVLSLILRGVFLAREQDTVDLLQDESPAAQFHYPEWMRFKQETNKLLARAKLPATDKPTLAIYHTLLNHADSETRKQAAMTFSRWELQNAFLDNRRLDAFDWNQMTDDDINIGQTEIHYMFNRCFIEENQILNQIERIAHIPTHVIHGRYDLVCLPIQADLLCAALKNVTRYSPIAGHSGDETETIHAMVSATQAILANLTQ